MTYLPNYKASSTIKKKNQYYDIFKPIKSQTIEFPNRKLQYSVERRTEKSQEISEKFNKTWKYANDRSQNNSPFKNEEEKQEKRGFTQETSYQINNQNNQNDQEDTFRKHRASTSFHKKTEEKMFTPKKIVNIGNLNYFMESKIFSQTPAISQFHSKKMEKLLENSNFLKEQAALKYPFKGDKNNNCSSLIQKKADENLKNPFDSPQAARFSSEDKKSVKNYDLPLQTNSNSKVNPQIEEIPQNIEKSQEKQENQEQEEIPQNSANSKEKQENQEQKQQPEPSDLHQNQTNPEKSLSENLQDENCLKKDENLKNEENKKPENIENNQKEEKIEKSDEKISSENVEVALKNPLNIEEEKQNVENNSKNFHVNYKESASFPLNSYSDNSRSDRMLYSMDLHLQQEHHELIMEDLGIKNLAGSEKKIKSSEEEPIVRNKSRTVCSKNMFAKENDISNDIEAIEEIDPKSLEKLMTNLENFNEKFKVILMFYYHF